LDLRKHMMHVHLRPRCTCAPRQCASVY